LFFLSYFFLVQHHPLNRMFLYVLYWFPEARFIPFPNDSLPPSPPTSADIECSSTTPPPADLVFALTRTPTCQVPLCLFSLSAGSVRFNQKTGGLGAESLWPVPGTSFVLTQPPPPLRRFYLFQPHGSRCLFSNGPVYWLCIFP